MDGTPEGEARYENISELVSVASKYDMLKPGLSLNVFLEEIALIADVDSMNEDDNAVVMMTVHSANRCIAIAGEKEGFHEECLF